MEPLNTLVIRMPVTEARWLGDWRLEQVDVLQDDDQLWLRIATPSKDQLRRVQALPGERFTLVDDVQLRAHDRIVPTSRLPQGTWTRLSSWFQVHLPNARFDLPQARREPLVLERSEQIQDSNALVTTFNHWYKFATSAPEIRLKPLSFAVAISGKAKDSTTSTSPEIDTSSIEVLILGTPTPPIIGQRFYETSGLILPCGWCWAPAIDAKIVRQLLQLEQQDLAIATPSGRWERLPQDQLISASRSAARETSEALKQESNPS